MLAYLLWFTNQYKPVLKVKSLFKDKEPRADDDDDGYSHSFMRLSVPAPVCRVLIRRTCSVALKLAYTVYV